MAATQDKAMVTKKAFSPVSEDFFEKGQFYELTFEDSRERRKNGFYQYEGREYEGYSSGDLGKFVFLGVLNVGPMSLSLRDLYKMTIEQVPADQLEQLHNATGQVAPTFSHQPSENINAIGATFEHAQHIQKDVISTNAQNEALSAELGTATPVPEAKPAGILASDISKDVERVRRPFFKPRAYKEDMSAPFDMNARFFSVGRTFFDAGFQEESLPFFKALENRISNAVALMLVVYGDPKVVKYNAKRTLGYKDTAALNEAVKQHMETISAIVSNSDDAVKKAFEFYRAKLSPDIAETDMKSEPVKTDSEKADVQTMLADVLKQIPDKNKIYHTAQKVAASVLGPQHFATVSHYLRPTSFRSGQAGRAISMPESCRAYYKGHETPALRQFALDGYRQIMKSDEFKAMQKSHSRWERQAYLMIVDFEGKMALKLEGPKEKGLVKAAKKPAVAAKDMTVTSVSAIEPTAEVKSKKAATVKPVEDFNSVSGIIDHEKTLIAKYSPQAVVLDYCAKEAKLGPKALSLLSRVFLRAEPQSVKVAAKALNMDASDAELILDGAKARVGKSAEDNNVEFISAQIRALKIA